MQNNKITQVLEQIAGTDHHQRQRYKKKLEKFEFPFSEAKGAKKPQIIFYDFETMNAVIIIICYYP